MKMIVTIRDLLAFTMSLVSIQLCGLSLVAIPLALSYRYPIFLGRVLLYFLTVFITGAIFTILPSIVYALAITVAAKFTFQRGLSVVWILLFGIGLVCFFIYASDVWLSGAIVSFSDFIKSLSSLVGASALAAGFVGSGIAACVYRIKRVGWDAVVEIVGSPNLDDALQRFKETLDSFDDFDE